MHLTVLYGELSRFDLAQTPPAPFSGSAGAFFKHRTFDLDPKPVVDVRVVGTTDMARPFVPGTRFLMLGAPALRLLQPADPDLLKWRGLIQRWPTGELAIATIAPIDIFELGKSADDDEDTDDDDAGKDVAKTSRANFAAWALHDYRKLISLPDVIPPYPAQTVHINAEPQRVAAWLDRMPPGALITLDIENRRQDKSLDCIGFHYENTAIVVPVYTPRLSRVIGFELVYRALVHLFTRRDITIIGHNLGYDLSVLCFLYNLPLPPNLYDTMLAMHREFPQLEKSLSHALGVYTYADRNHKADSAPNISDAAFNRLMSYNANDVIWTRRIRDEQVRRAALSPALADSVAHANRTLYTTLLMSFTGVQVDVVERSRQHDNATVAAAAWERCLRILTDDPNFNPASPPQTAALFYDKLGYPCEEFTDSGARSSGTKTLYKLAVKQPNPLIPIIVAAREAAKAASSLNSKLKTAP